MQYRGLDAKVILERVSDIEKTLEFLKRDIIKGIEPSEEKKRISLFGSVKAGDITEEMIDQRLYLEIWRTYILNLNVLLFIM